MTEREKMLAGELYDCGDEELLKQWYKAKKLIRTYNQLDYEEKEKQDEILNDLLGSRGEKLWITAPFYVDYGNNIYIGNNCEINMNCTFLDCNKITIGNNALIAPNVQIYTVFHPTNATERFNFNENGSFSFCKSLTAPVTIGDNVWIGGGSIILPGVIIGNNVTIGAGSVVTKSIPDNKVAYGNPCKVIRENN
ncbi:sugar O-acetyltransferase [Clostridium sp. SHJSY1]|uniref:sugar O-acetyltransferase n=1 Tax=Clostridium sp. SHJSY1 TaxID=2942483 RepID=UPI002876D66C|nr:sugar O-acetyltransferase [Clostridium sp. SHJSY1]MDS0524699.1 sugar O-acetyltransferase [Clostridium sp. SHJSY1]